MLHLRTLAFAAFVLLVLAASACSSADDADQPAASQVADPNHLSTSGFRIDSPSFQEKVRPYVRIPLKHTCLEDNESPPFSWSETPAGTQSLALIAEDTDHHTGDWVHWVLYNIPAGTTELPEGISTSTAVLPDGTTQGSNDSKNLGYNGPCPPPNIQNYTSPNQLAIDPPHRYYFRLYALDVELSLTAGSTKAQLLDAMEGHILAQANTMGKYTRPLELEPTRELKQALTQKPGAGPSPTPTP